MKYVLKNSYYSCFCGGTFYVDLTRQSYGIYPCVYNYVCDKCGRHKTMPCEREARDCAEFEMKQKEQSNERFKR